MDPDNLGICLHPQDASTPQLDGACSPGIDGHICALMTILDGPTTVWEEAPFDLGMLLAQNGGAARARYADLSLWTGDAIPDPPSCPDLGGAQPCGGSCGACAQSGATCVGRSPLHPVGVCDPKQSEPCPAVSCGANNGCFTYVVQPEAQADADQAGICLPLDQCNALAQKIPGGGKCTPGT